MGTGMGDPTKGIKTSSSTTITQHHNTPAQTQAANDNQKNQINPNPPQEDNVHQIEQNPGQQALNQQIQDKDDSHLLNPECHDDSRYAFVGQITQEAYECGISGLKMAGYGIGFSGGIGFNLPACFVALCIGGTAGAVYGIFKGTYEVLTADSQSPTTSASLHQEQISNNKNTEARNLFGLFPPENDTPKDISIATNTNNHHLSPVLNHS